MKKTTHIEKAKRIEDSLERLDKEKDWELVVEGIYGCVQNYIAYICETKLEEHRDTHKGLIKFLKEKDLKEIADLFQQIDELRIGKWYGSQHNGNTVKIAFEILGKIKDFVENEK